jgi:hypothetical protein
LKVKRAKKETNGYHSEISISKFISIVECEKPNKRLYNFEGKMMIYNEDNNKIPEKTISLDPGIIL